MPVRAKPLQAPRSPGSVSRPCANLTADWMHGKSRVIRAARLKYALPRDREIRFHPTVRKLKSIVAVILVALWLPASSHAFLQHIGFIHQVHAHDEAADGDHDSDSERHHEHGTDNHDAADGLCLVSSGKVPLAKLSDVASLPWLITVVLRAAEIPSALQGHSGPSPPGVAPPELSHCWQFSVRAALPIRAPSLVF